MAKIGMFISTANECLFQTEASLLKEHYKDIINKNHYDIDVFSFQGGLSIDKTLLYDDTILCNADDRDIALKYLEVFKFIVSEGLQYEWLIFTNTSTIVNLSLIYNNVHSLQDDCVYTQFIISGHDNRNYEAVGNFQLFNFKNIRSIMDNYENSYYETLPYNPGHADDIVTSYIYEKIGMNLVQLDNAINMFDAIGLGVNNNYNISESAIIRYRTYLPRDYRIEVEPMILQLLITQLKNMSYT